MCIRDRFVRTSPGREWVEQKVADVAISLLLLFATAWLAACGSGSGTRSDVPDATDVPCLLYTSRCV